MAAGVLGLIAVGLAVLDFTEKAVAAPETRTDIVTPATDYPSSFALSPDGRKIAYVASASLWVRSLDSTSAQPLPGTEGAVNPFWSPDSRSLGFFADHKLKRIDLAGGQPQSMADVTTLTTAQGAWSEQGVILFTRSAASYPELSPDGKRVAISRGPAGATDFWIEEVTRNSRFTFAQGTNRTGNTTRTELFRLTIFSSSR